MISWCQCKIIDVFYSVLPSFIRFLPIGKSNGSNFYGKRNNYKIRSENWRVKERTYYK